MLQRAASNAYSWWWASHIRTKQSKWMEQNLQDMEEKVQVVLRLLEEDGDSFAKRAEMYYKRRPELINFVEDSFRAYRALADRYDHISTELQNANTTIASVCPEQVQFDMDDNDDSPRGSRTPKPLSEAAAVSAPNIPKVPLPARDLKTLLTRATKKIQTNNKAGKTATTTKPVPKSGLNKTQAVVEIDKLQKSILAMQTEKEFVKSSYENGLAKYWEIDKQITQTQDKICSLQDEFSVSTVIEDDDARNLMASTALRSCEETLACLEGKHESSTSAAQIERLKIENASKKLDSLRNELHPSCIHQKTPKNYDAHPNAQKGTDTSDQNERTEAESSSHENEQHTNPGFDESFTLTEMTEKIDELVGKVLCLETEVSSQNALIQRLRTEADELLAIIQILEQEKVNGTSGTSNWSDKMMEAEKKLDQVQQINRTIDYQNANLKGHFTEAHCNLNHLSQILPNVIPDEVDMTHTSEEMDASTVASESKLRILEEEKGSNLENVSRQADMLPVAFDEKMKSQWQDNDSNLENELHGNDMAIVVPEAIKNYQEQEDRKRNDSPPLVPEAKMKSPELEIDQNQRHGTGMNSIDNTEKVVDAESSVVVTNSKSEDANASTKKGGGEMSEQKGSRAPDVQSQTTVDPEPRNTGEQINASKDVDGSVDVHAKENGKEEDEPNWQELFKSGLEDREKKLLLEYTTTLRNFKDLKKKLTDVEKENKDIVFQISVQRNFIARKDEEIQSLRQKLNCLMARSAESKEEVKNTEKGYGDEDCEELKQILMGAPEPVSAIEEKFRMDIDELLEENLDFWLRFSSSFHQIQKFQTEVEDLQGETSKLEEKLNKKQEGSTSASRSRALKSDARPIYKHLSGIQTEITIWIEQSSLLKTELQTRFSSLCNIQDEISGAISGALLEGSSGRDEAKFTSYQAAKFQGEILNMKQENNKVADELQAAADHASRLQQEIEKTLAKLNDDFKLSETNHHQNGQPQFAHSDSRSRVPLQSFIFGTKQKKPRYSIFSSMHPLLTPCFIYKCEP